MKLRSIHLLAAALLLGTSLLRAATIDELVASLRVEIEKSLAEAKATKNSGGTSSVYEVERLMSQLDSAFARDNFESIEQTLNQLAVARLSIEAKQRISELQREVPKAAEERQKAFAAQVNAALENARKACLTAKAEAELDATVAELSALKKQRGDSTNSEPRQRINTRLDGTIRFINRWQDYLVQMARGYDGTARNILRELAEPGSSSSQLYPVLPRAEILARLGREKDQSPDDVMRTIKTLDDVPKAVGELTRLSRESNGRSSITYEFSAPINELNQIARAHAAFQEGNYGSALLTAAQWEGAGGVRSPETMRLKTMLVLEVLPRYLELPENPQPKPAENPSEFLLRLAGESATAHEWARVARVLDAYRLTAFGYRTPPAWISGDIEACEHFVAGQNLEKAGRFVPAILAYQRALRTTGRFSPNVAATGRLAAIEKEKPDAFAEAGKEPQLRELLEVLRPAITPRSGGGTRSTPAFDQ